MIELAGVTKRFGPVVAVDRIDLTVGAGEFLSIVGPSGCGKTTLLRLLSGFEQPDSGEIRIAGKNVAGLPAYRRNVNQVFQNYALFPHLSVRDNIGFGLRMQKRPAEEVKRRVAEAMTLVKLDGLEKRKPHQLSGGQRQRVALARAIVPGPAVLLLDEPLSALDAKLRQEMQGELRQLQRRLGMTFVFVTHDRAEALALGDRIAVMNGGRIEQAGRPADVYQRPATAFVADFISEGNLLSAEWVREWCGGGEVCGGDLAVATGGGEKATGASPPRVSVRPEKIQLSRRRGEEGGGFGARVVGIHFQGAHERVVLEAEGGIRLVALLSGQDPLAGAIGEGERLWCRIRPEDLTILPGERTMRVP